MIFFHSPTVEYCSHTENLWYLVSTGLSTFFWRPWKQHYRSGSATDFYLSLYSFCFIHKANFEMLHRFSLYLLPLLCVFSVYVYYVQKWRPKLEDLYAFPVIISSYPGYSNIFLLVFQGNSTEDPKDHSQIFTFHVGWRKSREEWCDPQVVFCLTYRLKKGGSSTLVMYRSLSLYRGNSTFHTPLCTRGDMPSCLHRHLSHNGTGESRVLYCARGSWLSVNSHYPLKPSLESTWSIWN